MNKTLEFFEKIADNPTPRERGNGRNLLARVMPDQAPPHIEHLNFSGDYSGWAALKDDTYVSVGVSCDHLPSGLYRPVMTNIGITLSKMDVRCDKILRLPDSQSNNVVDEITTFRNKADAFKQRGLLHKRGILLWGPPGSGKTCTIQQIIELLINQHGGIAIQVDQPVNAAMALQMIRRVEKERQIVAIMEDLDALTDRHGEPEYLALLDGESQVDNIVYVATTNYPERLDKRFVDRPSRFDTIVWIGMPSADARRAYLEAKEQLWDKDELEYLVSSSKDFSIAHLRELLILIKCLGYDSEEAVNRLTSMKLRPPDSNNAPNRKAVGFAA